jgi:CDGSH-type Zn-finger protein
VSERTKITALGDGPFLVRGLVVVVDAEGNEFPSRQSTTKPFCDGTHSKVGFRAAERAVREEEGQGR